MVNMSYCRFENTLIDLYDCVDHLSDSDNEMNESEVESRERLLNLCILIAEEYGGEYDE